MIRLTIHRHGWTEDQVADCVGLVCLYADGRPRVLPCESPARIPSLWTALPDTGLQGLVAVHAPTHPQWIDDGIGPHGPINQRQVRWHYRTPLYGEDYYWLDAAGERLGSGPASAVPEALRASGLVKTGTLMEDTAWRALRSVIEATRNLHGREVPWAA